MPVLVTASELRTVLGVPVALYSDAQLDSIIETAEDAIGDFLVQHKVAIEAQRSESTTLTTLYATQPHKFYVGQTVTISGVTGHNGSKVVADIVDIYTFKITTTGATVHEDLRFQIPNGTASVNGLAQYNGVDAVEEAVLQIAVDVFQSRLAAGGTQQALDYTPAPYRMGRTLLYKVTGLISKYIDSNSQVG
jgi:hypothetical protein